MGWKYTRRDTKLDNFLLGQISGLIIVNQNDCEWAFKIDYEPKGKITTKISFFRSYISFTEKGDSRGSIFIGDRI